MSIRQYVVVVNDETQDISVMGAVARVPSGMSVQIMDMGADNQISLKLFAVFEGNTKTLPYVPLSVFRRWRADIEQHKEETL